MLLVADPTQDVYDKRAWTDEEQMLGAGFSGPWTELHGSYRLPSDLRADGESLRFAVSRR